MVIPRWVLLIALAALPACAQLAPPDPVRMGEFLARRLCASCHVFPEPGILDKQTWSTGALPLMESRLGVKSLNPDIPQNRLILEDWRNISAYYLAAAPSNALPQAPRAPVAVNLRQFTAEPAAYRPPAFNIPMVKIDRGRIYASNAEAKTLDELDSRGNLASSFAIGNPVVSMNFADGGAFITMIGTLSPSENPVGRVAWFDRGASWLPRWNIAERLHRPTSLAFADLNGDGKEDAVITTFGNVLGRFSWFEHLGNHEYVERPLTDRPGAVRAHVVDFNNDGRKDILVMMAQGKEGIFLFANTGGGKFQEVTILEHHPSWGSASFEMADMDGDGDLDIVAANGDNGEFASCLKNYHGVRIYLNDGSFHFAEKYFFPLHGAFKALPADFNGDGKMDLAVTAYFADFERAAHEGFVYLEGQGGLKFSASTFPASSEGRWLALDAGDLDADGDLDLVLGAANRTPYQVPAALAERWEKSGPAVLILRNNRKR